MKKEPFIRQVGTYGGRPTCRYTVRRVASSSSAIDLTPSLNCFYGVTQACQVMRDIDRHDRKDRELKRKARKEQKSLAAAGLAAAAKVGVPKADVTAAHDVEKDKSVPGAKDSMTMLAETSTTAEKASVEEAVASAVAATEAALDKALDSVAEKSNDMATIQV